MIERGGAASGRRVRFGVELPHRPELLGPAATRAEALGFDSVWIGDHVAFHSPTLDSLAALSYLAALTRRVRIGPCVYLLALRHPTSSPRRSRPSTSCRAAARRLRGRRRRRVPEGVRGVRRPAPRARRPRRRGHRRLPGALGAVPGSFAGRFTRFTDVVSSRGPSSRAARRSGSAGGRTPRSAAPRALGDGWIAYLVTPERFRDEHREDPGLRPPSPAVRWIPRRLRAGPRPLHGRRRGPGRRPGSTAASYLDAQYNQPFDDLARKYCLLGPPAACAERLAEFVAAGVRTFVIYFAVPAGRVLEQLERFATEVLAPVPDWAGPARRRPSHGGPDRRRAGRARSRPRGRRRHLHALRRPRPADLRRLPPPRHPGHRRPPRAGRGARRRRAGRASPAGSGSRSSCPAPASPTP